MHLDVARWNSQLGSIASRDDVAVAHFRRRSHQDLAIAKHQDAMRRLACGVECQKRLDEQESTHQKPELIRINHGGGTVSKAGAGVKIA
jgi:hypothetical protein